MHTVDEILDFAIEREQQAADFYSNLAERANSAWMKEMLLGFSKEEMRHKGKLKSVKLGDRLLNADQHVQDLKIADYLVDVEPAEDISLQDALIVAMKREKAAYRLYSDMARAIDDPELKTMFLGLAQEEAKHKLYFEVQYDDQIMRDN
ncbi:MAG: ferritin family protein [Chromatiaceae bacterium]|jgi:rubrerythrin|nr:ferritin family protein [Chromatiaceae bacterium]